MWPIVQTFCPVFSKCLRCIFNNGQIMFFGNIHNASISAAVRKDAPALLLALEVIFSSIFDTFMLCFFINIYKPG
jgi:hypothetical protein